MTRRIADDLFPEGGFTLKAPKEKVLPPFCEENEHVFKPVDGFVGRYRCQECEALGFIEAALGRTTRRGVQRAKAEGINLGAISLYKCPKCKGPTACYQGARYTVTDLQLTSNTGAKTCRVCREMKGKK
tara:strand:+ start:316 stop:702 length:387 start_codon:yes stop_codon:yes gene_type:complete